MDPRALRTIRLKNEHRDLMKLNGPIITIEPIGSEPYSKYRITFNIRTIISTTPTYQSKTVCILELPERFPFDMPRLYVVNGSQPPWHVNWYAGGTWCAGQWNITESLANYIYRCAKILQFDKNITDPKSPANKDAIPFWNENSGNPSIIPCDRQLLPIAEVSPKISILTAEKPKIIIN